MFCDVKNEITIYNPDPDIRSKLSNCLTFDNPEYAQKSRMNLWLGNTPKTISLMKSFSDKIIIPFGMLGYVFANAKRFESIQNHTKSAKNPLVYDSSVDLYPYQMRACIAALQRKNGVIIAPCGSGKTQIGLEIIRMIGGRALWLTHTADLLKQSMDRAMSIFDLPDDAYGTITEGKVNVGRVITFATVQTMSCVNLADFQDTFDIVVVDEAHHVVGTPTKVQMFYKVLSALAARYKFGLTATPTRADGLIQCMYALIGQQIAEITKAEIKKYLCPVEVVFRETNYKPNMDRITYPDGTINYTQLITDLCADKSRNARIVYDVLSMAGPALVLTDRVSHAQHLAQLLADAGESVEVLTAKTKKSARKTALARLFSGEIRIICATYSLAREGLDAPELRSVFFATPQKNEVTVVQSAGRVSRIFDGKDHGTVYDYVDDFGIFYGWQKKRKGFYKKNDIVIA